MEVDRQDGTQEQDVNPQSRAVVPASGSGAGTFCILMWKLF